QLQGGQPAFQKSPGIHAWTRVPLKVNLVSAAFGIRPPKEVVEAHLKGRSHRSISGNVSTDSILMFVGPNHHGHGVPAHETLDSALDFAASGVRRLAVGGDGIDVRRVGAEGYVNTAPVGFAFQLR